MFSLMRTRFGIPGVISIIALVFAMVGGAYAAKKYVITSTKQIKPSVLKALQGNAGPQGPAGPKGDAGPKGNAGPKGDAGQPGQNGKSVLATPILPGEDECDEEGGALVKQQDAASGVEVCNGAEGSPWTAGGTLPPGQTETGSFAGANEYTPVSFPIPLAGPLIGGKVHIAPNANCSGTVAEPKAAPGHLCVYVAFTSEGGNVAGPYTVTATTGVEQGAARSGAFVEVAGEGWGSWAVTECPESDPAPC